MNLGTIYIGSDKQVMIQKYHCEVIIRNWEVIRSTNGDTAPY